MFFLNTLCISPRGVYKSYTCKLLDMRQPFTHFGILLALLLQLTACSTLTGFGSEEPAKKPAGGPSFIELKDGSIIKGNEIRLTQPANLDFSRFDPLKRQTADPDWVSIDDRKIPEDSIYGYQDKGVFTAVYKHYHMKRLRKGRISIYSFETKGDNMAGSGMFTEVHMVFEKERGRFTQIHDRLETFYEAIKDHAAAAALCRELFPHLSMSQLPTAREKLLQVADVYNQ
jgi:hypothetical protein